MLLFALPHFAEGPSVGISTGMVGGFYLALTYAHWAERSHWTACWVTAVSHLLRNAFVCSVLVLSGEVPIVEPDYWYYPARADIGGASETVALTPPPEPFGSREPPVENERWKLAREAALAPEPEQSDGEAKTLFVYAGRPYTVRELTLVGYQRALAKVKSTQRYYLPEDAPRDSGYLSPARNSLPPDTDGDLIALYHHQLDGVIALFAAARVFELLKQQRPVDITRYYDPGQLEALVSAYAGTNQRFRDVRLASAKAGEGLEQSAAGFMTAFPNCGYSQKTFDSIHREGRLHNPEQLLNWQCFPWVKDGKVSPWVRNCLELQFVRYHVQALVEADKPQYIRFLENRWGRRQYYVIQGAKSDELPGIGRIIDGHVDAEGVLVMWHLGMRRINRDLARTGSEALVKTYQYPYINIEQLLQIPPEDMRPRTFLPFSEPVTGKRSYLYFVQENPEPHFRDYPSAPPHFLYEVSERALLRPLAEKVLEVMEVAEPFAKPSLDLVLGCMSNQGVPRGEFGVQYPRVVRD
jgi:hypothetical protein